MATTFATFYDAFKDLSVTGATNLSEPPLSIPTAKLPGKWVDIAGMGGGPFKAKSIGGWPTFKCRVVVLMAPIGQQRNETRWSEALAMMDTLNGAITGMTNPCKSSLNWEIDCEPGFAESKYFAVIATVTGEG